MQDINSSIFLQPPCKITPYFLSHFGFLGSLITIYICVNINTRFIKFLFNNYVLNVYDIYGHYIYQDMILAHITLALLILSTQSAVVLNPITGITTKNLMYSGTIEVGTQKLFFVFYGKDGQTNADNLSQNPLFVGVGTVGRSSHYLNVGGLGPKTLTSQLTLVDNANSITQFANVLFLDLLGSGFSFATQAAAIPKTTKQFGAMLTKAVNSFITQTNIGKSKSLYLVGESTFLRVLPGLDDIAPLKGIVHVSGWIDLYNVGKYYGTAGVQMKIFTDSERITIESTFTNCYNFQRSSKFAEAHNCYDVTLNYVQSKTKNRNLFNVQLVSNLTQFLPLVQYYFSQSAVVTAIKAPNTMLFEAHSAQAQYNVYDDLARNLDTNFTQYFKDYLSVKQIFITGDDDYITYRKATRNWLQNTISFVDSAKFKPLNLTEYIVNGKVAGYRKSVPQIAYYQLLSSGHFSYNEQSAVILSILKQLASTSLQNQIQNKVHYHNLNIEDIEMTE